MLISCSETCLEWVETMQYRKFSILGSYHGWT